ncbi:hypothetical protein KP803_08660 [Vibrio sp. ZSDE26]|uniref:Flagellin n=1 Tax=Vibrio amylolyticus TaxID=2847292 RepID=A0A9X1XPW4_9VIBR|nr:hypothetical protein [Vibrio amylolyticus]MCK6263349.1 hypothetical protein [Vibrio amylolyticus]
MSDLRAATSGANRHSSVIAKRAEGSLVTNSTKVAESKQRDPIRLSQTLTPEHTRRQSLLQRAQQQLASAQVAERSLMEIGNGLGELNKRLSFALKSGGASAKISAEIEKINGSMERTIQSAEFQQQPVVSRQLKPIYHGDDRTTFRIKGLDTARSVGRDETLVFNLGKGGANAVPVKLDSQATPEKQAMQFRQAFNEHGIGVGLDKQRQLVFSTSEQDWQRVSTHLKVTGQGERFPAGKANRARVETTEPRFEPLKLKSDNQHLRESQAETKQLMQQVKVSIHELRAHRRLVNEKITAINERNSDVSEISLATVEKDLERVLPKEASFTQVYQNIQTQANVHRHTVVALLTRS